MVKSWTIALEDADDGSGDLVLPFPQDLLDAAGWKEGDTLNWEQEGTSWVLTKKGFESWFHQLENFSLRSDRFYESLDQFTSIAGRNANLEIWLRAAFEAGCESNSGLRSQNT